MAPRFSSSVAVATLIAILALSGLADALAPHHPIRTFKVGLNPKQEEAVGSPAPGDLGASGYAIIKIYEHGSDLSMKYELTITNYSDLPNLPIASHIHNGTEGIAGPVVVPFALEWTLLPSGKTAKLSADIKSLTAYSVVNKAAFTAAKDLVIKGGSGFYVNIHTKSFPAGALRGHMG